MASPSIFGSTTSPTSREPMPSSAITARARRHQSASSSGLRALARLSIGRRWITVAKRPAGAAPTVWVGESAVTSSGCSASSACSSRSQPS
jgi:hypothetical protein